MAGPPLRCCLRCGSVWRRRRRKTCPSCRLDDAAFCLTCDCAFPEDVLRDKCAPPGENARKLVKACAGDWKWALRSIQAAGGDLIRALVAIGRREQKRATMRNTMLRRPTLEAFATNPPAGTELPPMDVTAGFLALCDHFGSQGAAVALIAKGRVDGAPALPPDDDWPKWNAAEMEAAVDYLETLVERNAAATPAVDYLRQPPLFDLGVNERH